MYAKNMPFQVLGVPLAPPPPVWDQGPAKPRGDVHEGAVVCRRPVVLGCEVRNCNVIKIELNRVSYRFPVDCGAMASEGAANTALEKSAGGGRVRRRGFLRHIKRPLNVRNPLLVRQAQGRFLRNLPQALASGAQDLQLSVTARCFSARVGVGKRRGGAWKSSLWRESAWARVRSAARSSARRHAKFSLARGGG